MAKQNLEILVVEDNLNHLANAKLEMQKKIDAGIPISVDYTTNLKEAVRCIAEKNYGGIISDVFYPSGMNKKEEKEIVSKVSYILKNYLDDFREPSYLHSIEKWESGLDEAPLGVHLAEETLGKTNFVFCTSTWHHGIKSQPVSSYAQRKEIRFIDRDPEIDEFPNGENGESKTKNWKYAYKVLIEDIVRGIVERPAFFDEDIDEYTKEMEKQEEEYEKKYNETLGKYLLDNDKEA